MDNLLNNIIGTLFLVCIFIIVVGGYEMIFSLGNKKRYTRGKLRVVYAIKGFAIILLAWLIIDTLYHILGAKNEDTWWTLEIEE